MKQALAGVRVLDFTQVMAGPFCTMLLGDLGADVVKVEPPSGDTTRGMGGRQGTESTGFWAVNRNKRGMVLNLKEPQAQEVARKLAAWTDIWVENYRPGVMAAFGLGYTDLREINPSLIYTSVSGFGSTGPYAKKGGFDLVAQGMSGIMSVTGEEGGPPVKCGVPLSDFSAGLYAAFAISALLARVRAGGPGGCIDVPMMGVSLAIAALQTSEFFGTGQDPKKLGAAHPRNAPYDAFRAKDGYFVLAAGNNKLWQSVCEVVGREDLVDDPRFLTTTDRAANQTLLKEILEAIFATCTAAHWLETFEARGVPCGPIHTYSQALSDAQVVEMGWVQPLRLPNGETTRTFASPLRIDGIRPSIRNGPPGLDAHRSEIIREVEAQRLEE